VKPRLRSLLYHQPAARARRRHCARPPRPGARPIRNPRPARWKKRARRAGFRVIPRPLRTRPSAVNIHEKAETCPNTFDRGNDEVLHEGLVIAIEPFLTTGATSIVEMANDGWTLTHSGTASRRRPSSSTRSSSPNGEPDRGHGA